MLALLRVCLQHLRNSNCQYTLGLETNDKWNLFDEPMYKILIAIKFIIKSYIWVEMRDQTEMCLGVCAREGQCFYMKDSFLFFFFPKNRKDSWSTTLFNCNWLICHNVNKVFNDGDHDARRSSKWYGCEMTLNKKTQRYREGGTRAMRKTSK